MVTKQHEGVLLGVNQKPVDKKKEDAATGNDGPRVKKSWNLVVPASPMNRAAGNEDKGCKVRKRKGGRRKRRRECRPPDQNSGRISSKEGVM